MSVEHTKQLEHLLDQLVARAWEGVGDRSHAALDMIGEMPMELLLCRKGEIEKLSKHSWKTLSSGASKVLANIEAKGP